MVHFALKYLYILFIFVFIFLLLFISNTNEIVQSYIIFSYFILLLPIFDFLLEYFKSEFFVSSENQTFKKSWNIVCESLKKIWTFIWKNIYFFLWVVFLYLLYVFFWDNIWHFLLVLFLVFWLYFQIDSRISFWGALLLLLCIPLLLILDKKVLAETLSIYLYYFLIIGVIFSVFEWLEKSISQRVEFLGMKIKKYAENGWKYFLSYPDDVVYDVLFLWVISFIWSLYWENFHNNLILIILFTLIVYLLAKIFGFRFALDKKKTPFFQKQNIEPFILFFSLSVIIFSSLGNMLLAENRVLIFFAFTGINFFTFSILVTDLWDILKAWIIRNIYIFAMMMIGVVWGIFYIVGWIDFFQKEQEDLSQIDQEIISESVDVLPILPENEPVVIPSPVKFNISLFQENLWLWSSWENVRILQSFLNDTWYYNFSFHGIYDENTRSAMRRFLSAECNWPQTNQWILWNQERICIQEFLQK